MGCMAVGGGALATIVMGWVPPELRGPGLSCLPDSTENFVMVVLSLIAGVWVQWLCHVEECDKGDEKGHEDMWHSVDYCVASAAVGLLTLPFLISCGAVLPVALMGAASGRTLAA
eukprot:RCo011074